MLFISISCRWHRLMDSLILEKTRKERVDGLLSCPWVTVGFTGRSGRYNVMLGGSSHPMASPIKKRGRRIANPRFFDGWMSQLDTEKSLRARSFHSRSFHLSNSHFTFISLSCWVFHISSFIGFYMALRMTFPLFSFLFPVLFAGHLYSQEESKQGKR